MFGYGSHRIVFNVYGCLNRLYPDIIQASILNICSVLRIRIKIIDIRLQDFAYSDPDPCKQTQVELFSSHKLKKT